MHTHVDQHQILLDLTQHRYAGIDYCSKVRFLLDGIKTKELDHVKTQIMASADLCNDFHACVNLFKTFIKQTSTNETRQANVSAIGHTGLHSNL